EEGATDQVLGAPQHPYTQALIAAIPSGRARGERLSAEPVRKSSTLSRPEPIARATPEILMRARHHTQRFRLRHGEELLAVDAVSLELEAGRTLGLVGESGSGKTTVARMLLGLTTPDAGTATLLGNHGTPCPNGSGETAGPCSGRSTRT